MRPTGGAPHWRTRHCFLFLSHTAIFGKSWYRVLRRSGGDSAEMLNSQPLCQGRAAVGHGTPHITIFWYTTSCWLGRCTASLTTLGCSLCMSTPNRRWLACDADTCPHMLQSRCCCTKSLCICGIGKWHTVLPMLKLRLIVCTQSPRCTVRSWCEP